MDGSANGQDQETVSLEHAQQGRESPNQKQTQEQLYNTGAVQGNV